MLSSLTVAMEDERANTSLIALHHLAIEKAVMVSGIASTFLRPLGTLPTTGLLFGRTSFQIGDTVYGPCANSAQALIHEVDIAEVAVLV